MKRLLVITLITGGLMLVAATAQADSVDFVAVPAAITSAPGSTVGWGYSITNNTSDYLFASALNAGATQAGIFDFVVFDFPLIAPGATVAQAYDPNLFTGLAQFTWDANAAPGTTNTGFFAIGFDFFDPNTNLDLGPAFDAQAPYSVSVATPVPEPASLALLVSGFGALLLFRRRL
jgi:hypothetical protein